MLVKATAPTRISLFGGGSDLPVYSDKNNGLVISLAINVNQEITLYSGAQAYRSGVNKVPEKGKHEFIQKILREFNLGDSKYISESEAILESGLGTSAA